MRVLGGAVVVTAAVACGTSSTGSGNTGAGADAGDTGGGTAVDAGSGTQPQTFAVALGVTGNGEIDGLGDPCTSTCLRHVQQGSIELQAVPAQGFTLDHWSVACAGTVCDLSVTSDMSVTAIFAAQPVQLPPEPVLRKLTVSVTGAGRVTSSPPGVDCPGACTMTVADGSQLTLNAATGTGMLFTGFSGACTGAACFLTLAKDANVTAAFVVDDCAGLVPPRLPPALVPNVACNGACTSGTSDDGTGNFVLRFTFGSPVEEGLAFFSLQDGTLQPQDSWFFGPGAQVRSFSEPSGFTVVEFVAGNFYSELSIDRLGNLISSQMLSASGDAAVAADPSGGFVVVRTFPEGAGFTETTWQRFDAAGAAASATVPIASAQALTAVAAASVTLSGNTLVETHVTSPSGAVSVERQWIGRNGALLTDPFGFPDAANDHSYQFLLDGGLLERSGNAFTRVWNDGETAASPLPAWLASRRFGLWLAPIHEGLGYAMAGTCGGPAPAVEVLSKSGRSCGCMAVPGLSAQASIGRDGSLIVPRNDHYEIYPLLFHP